MDFISNMDFASNFSYNFTSPETPIWTDLGSNGLQASLTLGLAGFVATFVSLLAYLSYTPKVDSKAPAFTSDTVPFIGSWRFFTQKM